VPAKKKKEQTVKTGGAFPVNRDSQYYLIPHPLQALAVPISSVKLWKKNPRANDEAAKKLATIIEEHGFRIPVVIDSNGIIMAGNTRYKAAKLLGMKKIPAVKQEFVSEAQATAFALADNKASEWSTWDDDLLADLFGAKSFEGYKGRTGFSDAERRAITMEPDIDRINKIKSKESGIKGKMIVLVMDMAQRDEIKEMLKLWVESKGLNVEIK